MDMVLDVTAGQFPEAIVANNTINLNVPGTLVAMVKLPNNTLTTVFTLGLVCVCVYIVHVISELLYPCSLSSLRQK